MSSLREKGGGLKKQSASRLLEHSIEKEPTHSHVRKHHRFSDDLLELVLNRTEKNSPPDLAKKKKKRRKRENERKSTRTRLSFFSLLDSLNGPSSC